MTLEVWLAIGGLGVAVVAWLVKPEQAIAFFKRNWGWVLAVGLLLIASKFGWLRWLGYSIPVYAVIGIAIGGSACLWFVLWLLAKTRVLESLAVVPWLNYVSDNIEGVEWHWKYTSDGTLTDRQLFAICPKQDCKCQLRPEVRSLYAVIRNVTLVCQNCGFEQKYNCEFEMLLDRVIVEVQRRIRMGLYPGAITKM